MDDVLLETEGKSIELFYDKMVWDETKQTVTLNFSDLLSRDASRAAWNVMICRRYLGWQVAGEKLQELHLAMPPVILVGCVNADAFYDSLYNQRWSRRVERFIRIMRVRAAVAMSIREADDDAKNVRLMGFEANQHSTLAILHSFHKCNLHQNNLMVGSTIQCIGRQLTDGMFAYSKLVRGGNFWIRTVLSVEHIVTQELKIEY